MSFTYAELKTAIMNYVENDEESFVESLDTFIRNTEERILKHVQLSLFRKNSRGLTTGGNPYLAVPRDFLAPFSLSMVDSTGARRFLQLKDVNFIQSFNPDPSNTAPPRYYAQFDVNHFILGPTPDANYEVELHYFYRPASLTTVGEEETTWLSVNASTAMLYGCLIEAYTYMKGEKELLDLYDVKFHQAMAAVKMHGEAKEVRDNYRYGGVIREKQ